VCHQVSNAVYICIQAAPSSKRVGNDILTAMFFRELVRNENVINVKKRNKCGATDTKLSHSEAIFGNELFNKVDNSTTKFTLQWTKFRSRC
jgi:hypothetical protein